MGRETAIGWTAQRDREGNVVARGATWNFLRGCSLVSHGCKFCYAMFVAARFNQPGAPFEGLARTRSNGMAQWTGKVNFIPEKLAEPLRWTKPKLIFTNSVSDLFHEDVPFEVVAAAFGVMAATPQHRHQVLTKRPERAAEFFDWLTGQAIERVEGLTGRMAEERDIDATRIAVCVEHATPHLRGWRPKWDDRRIREYLLNLTGAQPWPLTNVWMGVSIEAQDYARRAITLMTLPAAVRFVSAEPLLGRLDLTNIAPLGENALVGERGIDWVIAGAESGKPQHARPMDEAWVRFLRDQCVAHDTAFFYKQKAVNGRKVEEPELDGRTWTQMPGDKEQCGLV